MPTARALVAFANSDNHVKGSLNMARKLKTDASEAELGKILDDYQPAPSAVDHPPHYGGEHNVYEAIKVIDEWELGFCLGNVVKYIARAGKKGEFQFLEDLKKARWYLDHEISSIEKDMA